MQSTEVSPRRNARCVLLLQTIVQENRREGWLLRQSRAEESGETQMIDDLRGARSVGARAVDGDFLRDGKRSETGVELVARDRARERRLGRGDADAGADPKAS